MMFRSLVFAFSLSSLALAQHARPPVSDETIPSVLERGIEILLERQENFDKEGGAPQEWPYEGVYRVRNGRKRVIPLGYRIGGTAICAWALIEAPGYEKDKERQKAVERGLDFILDRLRDPKMEPTFERGYDVRGWGHAYALNFLLRLRKLAYVTAANREHVDVAIKWLVNALEKSEIEDAGGWNYSRRSSPKPSTFMTAPTVQFLLAAKADGEKVDSAVIQRAIRSIDDARLESGAYQYGTNKQRRSGRGFEAVEGSTARSPVCETTLFMTGNGDLKRLRKSIDDFFTHWEWLEKRRRQNGTHVAPYMIAPYYFYYGHYYTAQAIECLPEKERAARREQLYKRLTQVREKSGGWNDRVFDRSENFGTAMVMLALMERKNAAK